ncbi:hypothetical protein AAC387_Pa03g4274 [Persea americana]
MQTVFSGAAGDKHCIEFGFQFIGNSEDDDYGPDGDEQHKCLVFSSDDSEENSYDPSGADIFKKVHTYPSSVHQNNLLSVLVKEDRWLVEIFLLIEVNMKNGLRIHQGTWVHCPCRY